MSYSVTKQYRDLPAAHRQPNHDGHCRLIHGHNWGFDITFKCDKLDGNGFVVDVGKLGALKEYLAAQFDHTLLLNLDDPFLHDLQLWLASFSKIVLVPNCGMEGLAKLVCDTIGEMIANGQVGGEDRGLKVIYVVCWEDSKNSATYLP